jgi:glycosyltransferase involved in cell wall biosynthesis
VTAVISVIIPCFNSGRFLADALDSVRDAHHKYPYEVIIIDDGSTEENTLTMLQDLARQGYTVIHQENRGPAAARNVGIRLSKSRYLLFLDSDNKIRRDYMDKGVAILDSLPDVGIAYGNPSFFGDSTTPRFITGKLDMYKMLDANYIDMCAVIRKEVFENVGLFDEERIIIGHEDWEFWIRAYSGGWKFHFINETLFDYRITHDSLIHQASHPGKFRDTLRYIYAKHLELFVAHYKELYLQSTYYIKDQRSPLRSMVKFLYLKYFEKSKRS